MSSENNVPVLGSFYESMQLSNDDTESISDETGRLFNSGAAVTLATFDALDTNSDGVINSSDSSFNNLTIWVDADEDGILDSGELKTMAQAGISALMVARDKAIRTAANATSFASGSQFDTLRAQLGSSGPVAATSDGLNVVGTNGNDNFNSPDIPNLLGGGGNDIIAGGGGSNTIWGGTGNDSILGAGGNDRLMGEEGADLLAGQVGNDTIYGGDGNDTIFGHTGSTDVLNGSQTDNDFLYGGDGSDTLYGSAGNDYIDGGMDADLMLGGTGNDTYIVNSRNDFIYEFQNEGTSDSVYSSISYLLNEDVENLRLLGSDDLSATGNRLNNQLFGNAGDNDLDGVTGVDTMTGYAGNDTYYVDNASDTVVESASEGTDTVKSYISWTLGSNLENLTLLGFGTAEQDHIDGQDVLVYGAPKQYQLDYYQGDKNTFYQGDCTLATISNIITLSGGNITEEQVVDYAIANGLCNTVGSATERGGTNETQQLALLDHYGFPSTYSPDWDPELLAEQVKAGKGILLAVNGHALWNDAGPSTINHAITVTGVVYTSDNSDILGFVICDSGNRTINAEMRYITIDDLADAADLTGGYMIYTQNAIRQWNTNINGTGNSLNNVIIGNEGNNSLTGDAGADTLQGGAGNDTLTGGTGNDTMQGGTGDDTYVIDVATDTIIEGSNEGNDTVQSSVNYTLGSNVENLTITGGGAVTGTGNSLNNILTGNGSSTLVGGTGDDTYVITTSTNTLIESNGEGNDTVRSSVSHTLAANFENLFMTGTGAVTGTGNSGNNILGGNGSSTLIGGDGDDTYVVSSTTDTITEYSSGGNDTVQSSVNYTLGSEIENLTLTGSASNGTGNSGNNVITGNSGANSLSGGDGVDTLAGGAGDDIYVVDTNTDTLTENSGEGTDTVQSSVSLTLAANIENLTLTGGSALTGTGNSLNNVLTGNGSSTLAGGTGDDTYVIASLSDIIVENSDEGIDTVQTSLSYTLATDLENLTLTGSSAVIGTGNAANNTLKGNGNSTLIGGTGDDTYIVSSTTDTITEYSGEGTDTVQSSVSYTLGSQLNNLILTGTATSGTGNSLNNVITGNNAYNTLSGGGGTDTLIGGAGADTYIIDSSDDVVTESYEAYSIDWVNSSATYTLSSEVEYLTLTGSSNINGTGNNLANRITGNIGNNSLTGGDGNDTIYGGGGTDTLVGGLGNDEYHDGGTVIEDVGGGIDTVYWGSTLPDNVENLFGSGNVYGNSADNQLGSSTANTSIIGGAGNDTLYGLDTADVYSSTPTLVYLPGNSFPTAVYEFLGTFHGNQTLVGGDGDDTYYVGNDSQNAVEETGTGIDTVVANQSWTLGANLENLIVVSDPLEHHNGTGNSLNNIIMGDYGSNVLSGAGGNDILIGGDGAEAYNIFWGPSDGYDTLDGGTGNDYLFGGSRDDSLLGGDGNDTLDGGIGNDTLKGGNGNDIYYVDSADDFVDDNAGTNIVYASSNFILTSGIGTVIGTGSGNINLTGTSSTESLTGNAGNNILTANGGNDTLTGGLGDDTYVITTASSSIVEDTNAGIDTVNSEVTYTLTSNVENLVLTGTTNMDGTGNSLDNVITGNSMRNDLDGGTGDDTLIGGAGNDTYYVDSLGDSVVENASEGTDVVKTTVSTYVLADNVEKLELMGTVARGTGNSLNNTLTGNASNNTLDGGAGNDTMIGGDGDDTYIVDSASDSITETSSGGTDTVLSSVTYTLPAHVDNLVLTGTSNINGTGSAWDNYITGNSGANSLSGGDGNDTLDGDAGNDTLVGGVGNDTFVFGTGDGTDSVSDSNNGTEKILFDNSVSQSNVAFYMSGGNLQIGYLGTSDLVTVNSQTTNSSKVERFELSTGYYLSNTDISTVIQQMSSYASSHSLSFTSLSDVKASNDLMNIINTAWHT